MEFTDPVARLADRCKTVRLNEKNLLYDDFEDTENFEDIDIDEAMSELDTDGDGQIDYDEFVSWYLGRDDSDEHATTTLGGLRKLVADGTVTDETYMCVDGVHDDWIMFTDAKDQSDALAAVVTGTDSVAEPGQDLSQNEKQREGAELVGEEVDEPDPEPCAESSPASV